MDEEGLLQIFKRTVLIIEWMVKKFFTLFITFDMYPFGLSKTSFSMTSGPLSQTASDINNKQKLYCCLPINLAMRLRRLYILAVFHFIFCGFLSLVQAQATFDFDQRTKAIITGGEWKVGNYIKVTIKNYGGTDLKYTITYKAEEKVNDSGLEVFRQAAGSTNALFDAGLSDDFEYLLVPIQNKDYSIITIEEYDGTLLRDKQIYSFRNRGGIKFDVSTGFFVTGLKDESYILKNDTIPNKGVITMEASGDLRVGLGMLAHLHSRWNGVLNLGVSGGFELDNDAKVGYLAGGSLFLGHDQKFVLSGGEVFGKRATLSNAYKEGESVDLNLTVVPTVDIWDRSWFGSLTYNF